MKSINEAQFNSLVLKIYEEELLNQRWESLNESEKKFVVGFLSFTNPDKKINLNESKLINTVGDIVGIFDPTGIVDSINAISYFKQGDDLYGLMSLISALPIVGDVIGKPIIGALKYGKGAANAMRMAKGASGWAKLGGKYPMIGKLLNKIPEIGAKLIKVIEKVPGGKMFANTIRKWVGKEGILTQAAKIRKTGGFATKTSRLLSSDLRAFRDFGIKKEWGWWKRMWKRGGFLKNRQLSRHLAKTKFYLSLLDYMGIANFVGPEELEAKVGEAKLDQSMQEYMNTPEAKANWESEMSQLPSETETEDKSKIGDAAKKLFVKDPIMALFGI